MLVQLNRLSLMVVQRIHIAVSIQMRYNITSQGVGARHCRAPTGVLHVNENRYIDQAI
ncbi:MAG: hypothetical protein V7K97_05660 [Nostoc sp.]|uniref:hypothetical protein n=1 Tax=Nostoc sp. TaxID=1180 RepID=UPI002FF4940D